MGDQTGVNKDTLLKYLEMKKWREISCSKWLSINGDVAIKKALNCTDVAEMEILKCSYL